MSRFVSEGSKADNSAERNDAWIKAKQDVEALKKPKQSATGSGLQEGGKSLYETLQVNKEKKQAEFEESTRLKNQFQSLNEDDADFLDSVLESTRAKEAAVKKDTAEQLDAFRKQREETERLAREQALREEKAVDATTDTTWTKKRRRKDADYATSKLRRTSSAEPARMSAGPNTFQPAEHQESKVHVEDDAAQIPSVLPNSSSHTSVSALGLVGYDSDDDDDDD